MMLKTVGVSVPLVVWVSTFVCPVLVGLCKTGPGQARIHQCILTRISMTLRVVSSAGAVCRR